MSGNQSDILSALDAVVDAVSPVNTPGAVEWWRFTDTERLTVVRRMLETQARMDALVALAIGLLDRCGVVAPDRIDVRGR